MILTHSKFDDDIFARFLIIMKNVVILIIKEYRRPTLRLPCDVIDDVIIMKKTFWSDNFCIFQRSLVLRAIGPKEH